MSTTPIGSNTQTEPFSLDLIMGTGIETKMSPRDSEILSKNEVQNAKQNALTAVNKQEESQESEPIHIPDLQELKTFADEIQNRLDDSLSIRFRKDNDTGRQFFQLVERSSGDIVRQYPPEEMLALLKNIDSYKGLLFSDHV